MKSIEPIRFEVEGRGLDPDENYERRIPDMSSWDETHDFLLHQVLSEFCDELSRQVLEDKYREVIREEMEPIQEISPAIAPPLPPQMASMSLPFFPATAHYISDETCITPIPDRQGVFFILSNNKNKCRNLKKKLIGEFENAHDLYHGLGIEQIRVHAGRDYSTDVISSKEPVSGITQGEPDDFEEEIFDEVKSISESFINNATVGFGEYAPEPEYDLLLSLTPNNILNIEVKDYSGVDDQPDSDDIIDTPLKNAELLDVELTLLVVRGIDDDRLDEFMRSAELRDRLEFCSKSDIAGRVEEYVEEIILPQTMSSIGGLNLEVI